MNFTYYSKRLILKVLLPEDAKDVLHFYEENKDFFEAWEPDRSPNFYTEAFQRASLSYEYHEFLSAHFLRFYLYEQENPNKIIGSISFHNYVRGSLQSCTIGYKIHQLYCRKGYATEALSFAIALVFDELHFHRIEALVHPSNLPSKALLTKLGFYMEGIARNSVKLHGSWCDHERYGLLEDEFYSK